MARETFAFTSSTLRSLRLQRERLEWEDRRRALSRQCLSRRFPPAASSSLLPRPAWRPQYCRDPAVHNVLYTGDLQTIKNIFKDEALANVIVETVNEELMWAVGAEPSEEAHVPLAHRGGPRLPGLREAPAPAGGGGGRRGGREGRPARQLPPPAGGVRPAAPELRRQRQRAVGRGAGPAAPLHLPGDLAVRGAAAGARGPGEPEHRGPAHDPAARGCRARPRGPPPALPVPRGRPGPPHPGRGDGPQRRLRQRRPARPGRALLPGGPAAAGERGRRPDGRPEEPHPPPQRLRQLPPPPGGAAAPARGRRERPQLRRLHAPGLRPAGGGGVPGPAAREHHRHPAGSRGGPHQSQDAEVLRLGPSCPGSGAELLRPDPLLRFLGGSGASGDVAGAQGLLRLRSPADEPAPAAAAPGALCRAEAPGGAVPFRHPRTQTAPGSAGLSAPPSRGLHPVKEKMHPWRGTALNR